MGDIVDSGIGLLYWPASLCSLVGRFDNYMLELALYPQSGTMATSLPVHTNSENQCSFCFPKAKRQGKKKFCKSFACYKSTVIEMDNKSVVV
jgi:hypothetical protein